METIWDLEMRSKTKLAKLSYRPPLARKKQRVEARPEPNGKVKEYSEEEKYLYLLKNFSKD